MAEATELPFDRTMTAREEAAAIERAKRDAEVAEFRRLRNAVAGGGADPASAPASAAGGATAAEAARRKRDEEIEQLRLARAGENEETRRRLQERGGTLTVDMDAWRSEQQGAKNRDRNNRLDARQNLHGHGAVDVDAWRKDQRGEKERDRRGRLEAMGNLQGHRGYYATKTNADVDRDAHGQAQRDRMEEMGRLSLGGGGDDGDAGAYGEEEEEEEEEGATEAHERKMPGKLRSSLAFKDGADGSISTPEDFAAKKPGKMRSSVAFKEADDELIPPPENESSRRTSDDRLRSVSFQSDALEDAAAAVVDEVDQDDAAPRAPSLEEWSVSFKEEAASTADAPPAINDDDDGVEPMEEEQMVPTETLVPPTYARVDIKFSFGLIVRSSAAEGIVGGENLRDNETLRKCMEGTSKILIAELPTPPDVADLEKRATPSSFRGMFPEAYYNPSLEPTVISIEEEERREEEGRGGGGGGKSKGGNNKRTLVKASFPVFLREEAESDEGKKLHSRILKETKTTVFKSLRGAVSGGSFLNLR
jgi:hypothetical protein